MTIKNWVVFIVCFVILALAFAVGDALLAGVFYLIALLCEPEVAGTVFKWIFLVLFFIEMGVLTPYLYSSVKKERIE